MIHVCFVYTDGTGNSAKFVGTAMLSLFENVSKPLPSVTVHILHDNTLTADVRNKFFYFAGRCNQVIKFYNVEELCADKIEQMHSLFPNANRFNNAMFYKLLVPQILPTETDKAIYLEANTVVNMDISELWRVELGENMLAAVPALSIGSDIHTQDRAVADGFIKPEDYFNPGVMLMNLKLLRGEEEKIFDGLKFAAEHKYLNLLDQTVLNYCFSTQAVKLPAQFNQFVRWARRRREPVKKGIYYYTAYTLQLDMKDPFNRLWMDYFVKTPWFDAASIGRLYEGFQQIHTKLKKSLVNLSVILNGKARGFFAVPEQIDGLKKIFHINDGEEIVALENQESLKKLIDAMKESQGKKVFFIMVRNFPFNALTQMGFVYGRDFLNGIEFLSEEQGMSLNSYPLLHAM
ncbi:MAG: hypothetical protein SR3Q1_01815 [Quinella sp. 3Q1]|nr:hypothetical protein [Quinella sp. 3Q1]MBR6887907.1 hypothetical protein [Selenomonadaceae bacterium]